MTPPTTSLSTAPTLARALSAARSAPAPPVAPPQTAIVCTEALRLCLQLPASPALACTRKALVVTPVLLPHLAAAPGWRWVLVAARAAELRALTAALEVREGWEWARERDGVVVVLVGASESEECAVRRAAVEELGGPGVLLVRDADAEGDAAGERGKDGKGLAVAVLERLTTLWKLAADGKAEASEAAVKKAYGGAEISSRDDAVLPPGWDTVGKIRAVTDAAGLDYDAVMRESSWRTPAPLAVVEGGVPDVERTEEAERKRRERAREVKRKDLAERSAFLTRLSDRIAERKRAADPVDVPDSAESAEGSAPAESDFFQKLLSAGR